MKLIALYSKNGVSVKCEIKIPIEIAYTNNSEGIKKVYELVVKKKGLSFKKVAEFSFAHSDKS